MLLAIETSCDETGVALFSQEGSLIKHLVYSQVAYHSPFGGIVPEIASRKQLEVLYPLTKTLLKETNTEIEEIKAVAVTFGPGLIGSLLVGTSFAKSLSLSLNIPLIAVDHLEGHIFSIFLERQVEFPFISLLISGGHTCLFVVKSFEEVILLGHTRDDAVGEAFDKVAKLLGLGYPGGPVISKLAKKGEKGKIKLPRPLIDDPSYDFSFSGLKTAIVNFVKKHKDFRKEDLCLEFEEAVCDVLISKSLRAAKNLGIKKIIVVGGVASNERLRNYFTQAGKKEGIEIFFPSPEFCTDNAAMIGVVGFYKWKNKKFSNLETEAYANAKFKLFNSKY